MFISRVFALTGEIPQLFYEYVSSHETVLMLVQRLFALNDAGVASSDLETITVGVEWFESGFRVPDGRLPLPTEGEPFRGRHSVAVTGIADDGALVFQNSWGRSWGDDGIGYISREYFEAHVDEVFVQRSCRCGPSPRMIRRLRELEGRRDALAQAWRTPNPDHTEPVLYRDQRHALVSFRTYSVETEGPVEVLEVRNGYRAIGRCHLFHVYSGDQPISRIDELFVLPAFRRRGYGALLEHLATERARELGSPHVAGRLYEADAVPAARATAEAFAERTGYEWDWTAMARRPNIVGVATKELVGS